MSVAFQKSKMTKSRPVLYEIRQSWFCWMHRNNRPFDFTLLQMLTLLNVMWNRVVSCTSARRNVVRANVYYYLKQYSLSQMLVSRSNKSALSHRSLIHAVKFYKVNIFPCNFPCNLYFQHQIAIICSFLNATSTNNLPI